MKKQSIFTISIILGAVLTVLFIHYIRMTILLISLISITYIVWKKLKKKSVN